MLPMAELYGTERPALRGAARLLPAGRTVDMVATGTERR